MNPRRKPRIDVIPLIDVLLVLIIFFLVTMQFQDLKALNVKLPKIDTAGSNQLTTELVISIQEDGSLSLNGKDASTEILAASFKKFSEIDLKPIVLVLADENAPLKFVTKVVDLCRKHGLEDFRLQSR